MSDMDLAGTDGDTEVMVDNDGSGETDTDQDGTAGDGEPIVDPVNNDDYAVIDSRGGCDLDTGFDGDDGCMLPPDEDVGIQIHVGPDDYTDDVQISRFIMRPGNESSECYMMKMPNTEDFYYDSFELSGRPGTHHIINTLLSTDLAEGWGNCESFLDGSNRVGGLEGASKPYMPRVPVAPENEGLGQLVRANLQGQFDMHYFNIGDTNILREFWLNLYYKDPDTVTETPQGIVGMGGTRWFNFPAAGYNGIAPGTHENYTYSCPVTGIGEGARIIQVYGHTHAHGIRETAWILRGDERIKIFEQFHYLDQQIFNYNSVTENPPLDQGWGIPGALSGMFALEQGDIFEWECEINNDSDVTLTYTNEVFTGEMCNIWGDLVAASVYCIKD